LLSLLLFFSLFTSPLLMTSGMLLRSDPLITYFLMKEDSVCKDIHSVDLLNVMTSLSDDHVSFIGIFL